ncbi:hypothetical protein O181_086867 [Austropuccinia psidii MF-1]|uniref:39S ribosomal protein L12, mitochondrial n=1 Tax=Austropuccinia psidii MF-1 TaxID=1389203 RepID=A0A9Q3INL0_9BASI|nr:hypothetical protein [Austropuccinia psidii MF-1]
MASKQTTLAPHKLPSQYPGRICEVRHLQNSSQLSQDQTIQVFGKQQSQIRSVRPKCPEPSPPAPKRSHEAGPLGAPIPDPSNSSQPQSALSKIGSDGPAKTFTPKIDEIVKSISQLTLLEAADLVDALKSRLNITETAFPLPSNFAAGNQAAAATAQSDTQSEKKEPEKPKEKTTFNLTLKQIDATQKAKVIKEVKTIMPNMNLVEAKKFVESLPKVLKEDGTKDEIEKLKKALESVGATVQVD